LLFTGGAAGIRAMHLKSYFDENIIFVLSKDQTFRNRSTLENPEQFLILVTHLFRIWFFGGLRNLLPTREHPNITF
jgi:hypothetical protein